MSEQDGQDRRPIDPVNRVLDALQARLHARHVYKPALPMRDGEAIRRQANKLRDYLERNGEAVCEGLVNAIKDPTVTRVYLCDFVPLKEFFKSPPDYSVVDVLSQWMYRRFQYLVRVVGDHRYAGFSLEFTS